MARSKEWSISATSEAVDDINATNVIRIVLRRSLPRHTTLSKYKVLVDLPISLKINVDALLGTNFTLTSITWYSEAQKQGINLEREVRIIGEEAK